MLNRSPRLPDHFKVLRALETSGERGVWLARDEHLGRLVVVKRVAVSAAAPLPEALFGVVRHSAAAALLAVIEHAKQHWLVSEYVDGPSLVGVDRCWPAPQVAVVVAELASAVQAFVDAGVVHGDISPGNVLIDASGAARLVDFGNARRIGERASGAGTPGFAPPEAVLRQPLLDSSDLWSVAALGVWLLCAEAPAWIDGADGTPALCLSTWQPPDRSTAVLYQLLRSGLSLEPATRPTASAWCAELAALARLYAAEGGRGLRRYGSGGDWR